MADKSPQEKPESKNTITEATSIISEGIRGILGFFQTYVQIATDSSTPNKDRVVFLVMLVIGAIGIFALIFNNTNVSLISWIIVGVLFVYTINFVSQHISTLQGNSKQNTLFAVSFFVYEAGSRKEQPIKNATIKLMLDPRPVELDKTQESGISHYVVERRHYRKKVQTIVGALGFATYNQDVPLTDKRIEIALTKLIDVKKSDLPEKTSISRPRVRVQMGDILEGGYDLTILPCSAKGTISSATRRHTENYDIPLPQPMKHGDISELIPFKGAKKHTKYIVYAASVFNDFSSTEIIEEIGRGIGDLTMNNSEILLVEAPLLGTGAGRLDTLDAAFALKKGFESTRTNASLTIFVYDFPRYQQISQAFAEL